MTDFDGDSVLAAGMLLMLIQGEKREFLLLRHSDRWDLPKGHCEPGETFHSAALRETIEETGISAEKIQLDDRFEFQISYPVCYAGSQNRRQNKIVRYFLGYLRSRPRLKLSEHQDAHWFSWNPPHKIQAMTVDPLLEAVDKHLRSIQR